MTDTGNDIPRISKLRKANYIIYTNTYRSREQELYRRRLQSTDRAASELL
jgi:hypothetical protein